MKKGVIVWLIIGISLILIGCLTFGGAMSMIKWNFLDLSTSIFETKEYVISEKYSNITILSKLADVVIEPSGNEETKIICKQQTNLTYSVKVTDNTLLIETTDTRKWIDHISFNLKQPKITLCVPQGEYDALTINGDTGYVNVSSEFKFNNIEITQSTGKIINFASATNDIVLTTNTGGITVGNVSAKNLSVTVSTGKVNLADVSCENLVSNGNTGDITLKNTEANEINITRSTGDVNLENCDGEKISIKTSTGDITGTLKTQKVFVTESNTGKIDVPNSSNGGTCELKTSTGDIKIRVK